MNITQADAELLPSPGTYSFGEKLFRPIVNQIGGYAVYNMEALRPVDGKAFFAAPNHRSNWDSIALGLAMLDLPELTAEAEGGPLQARAIHYMAKDTLWRYPVVKQFVERCGAFKVKRGRGIGLEEHQVNHVTHLADNDGAMVIYPQGHRERGVEDEKSLDSTKFKTTIAHLHLAYGIPIVPVGIYGPVGRGPKFPRTIMFDDPIFSEKMDPAEPAFKSIKREVMENLHGRLNITYQEVRRLHLEKHPETGWLDFLMRGRDFAAGE
jgi:1-acyl-sn-glycerol-3-phosphate acyltransferase